MLKIEVWSHPGEAWRQEFIVLNLDLDVEACLLD